MRVRVSGVVAVCGGGVRRGAGTRKKLWAFREKWGTFSEKCAGFEQKRRTFCRDLGRAVRTVAAGGGKGGGTEREHDENELKAAGRTDNRSAVRRKGERREAEGEHKHRRAVEAERLFFAFRRRSARLW